MVSETFLNLKEEKKERIIRAALTEFSRVPMNEASVTNIVKEAGISRGSFYQYFGGKEALYKYLIKSVYAKHRQDLYRLIQVNEGDLYQSLLDFYQAYIDEIMGSEYFSFYENTFLHVNHYLIGQEGLLSLTNRSQRRKNEREDFVALINTEHLRTESEADLLEFIYFTVNLIHQMVVEGFINGLSGAEIKERSVRAVNWLYYGIQEKN